MADCIVIVAGGKGLRMGGDVPKQFLQIGGRPVLMHTIEAFYRWQNDAEIIVVLPEEQHEYWRSLIEKHSFEIPHRTVSGGETRFHSVKNALATISDDKERCVAIHDGVRPFVSQEVISRCFEKARQTGAALPAVPLVETLRHTEGYTVDRREYVAVQTPQVFSLPIIKKAYRQEYQECFTDDASVVETIGQQIAVVEGNRENIKITTPFDIIVAEAILSRK